MQQLKCGPRAEFAMDNTVNFAAAATAKATLNDVIADCFVARQQPIRFGYLSVRQPGLDRFS